jgi:hypothetical protein
MSPEDSPVRLRCCVLLCVAAGLASADTVPDYFSDAFKRALPPPFGPKTPGKDSGWFALGAPPKQPSLSQSGACAIPLKEAPFAKDRRFSIRKLHVSPDQRLDEMARPTMPACRQ